jgi:hypothetical protein
VTLTINDTTMTTYTRAAETGREPAAAAGDWLTPPPADRHPDGPGPRSRYDRFEPRPDEPKVAWEDPPWHAAGAEANP